MILRGWMSESRGNAAHAGSRRLCFCLMACIWSWGLGVRSVEECAGRGKIREIRGLSFLMDSGLPRFLPRYAGRCCMATTTKTRTRKAKKTQIRDPLSPDHVREHEASQVSPSQTQFTREQEPLENGVRRQEAPEARQTQHSEAPEAGGETECSEHETFTRGRSMS